MNTCLRSAQSIATIPSPACGGRSGWGRVDEGIRTLEPAAPSRALPRAARNGGTHDDDPINRLTTYDTGRPDMERFEHITAIAAPLDSPDIDTDMLIPQRFLRKPLTVGYR